MPQKKLSIKTNNKGKLVLHKKKTANTTPEELEQKIEADAGEVHEAPPKKKIKKKVKVKKEKAKKPPPWEEEVDGSEGAEGTTVKAKVQIGNDVEEINVADVVKKEGEPMANVGFNISRSINLGNYESLKIGVSINVPSVVTEEEIEGNFEYAKDWCEGKLEDIVAEYDK